MAETNFSWLMKILSSDSSISRTAGPQWEFVRWRTRFIPGNPGLFEVFRIFGEQADDDFFKRNTIHGRHLGKGQPSIRSQRGIWIGIGKIWGASDVIDPDVKLGIIFVIQTVKCPYCQAFNLETQRLFHRVIGVGMFVVV